MTVHQLRLNPPNQSAARTSPDAKPGCFVRLTAKDTGVGMDRDTVTYGPRRPEEAIDIAR